MLLLFKSVFSSPAFLTPPSSFVRSVFCHTFPQQWLSVSRTWFPKREYMSQPFASYCSGISSDIDRRSLRLQDVFGEIFRSL